MQPAQTGKRTIFRQFIHYAVPSVTGMVVSSLYTVVDGIFVGRGVGQQALAAVNIVYPFIMLQIAVSMLVAMGGANLFSISRGRGNNTEANGIFRLAMVLLAGISLLMNLGAILFSAPLCRLLGASDALLPQAQSYLFWVALFGVLYIPGLGLSIFVRNDGAPRLEMVGTLCGALTNIFLDWLFIMPFGWGVAGAAIATGIGQMVSVAIYASHLLGKKNTLRLGWPGTAARQALALLKNGLPSFLMEFSQSAITLSFNIVLVAHMGDIGVAAYSVVMYVCSIFNMVLIGIVQGCQPILSFSHGRQDSATVSGIYRLGVGACLASTTLFYALVALFGGSLAGLFVSGDTAFAQMAAGMMRVYFIGFFPIGISLMNILWFQATQREGPATLVSFLRCLGFVQLFLAILPGLWGPFGIFISLFCGEACTCLISVLLHHRAGRTAGWPSGRAGSNRAAAPAGK